MKKVVPVISILFILSACSSMAENSKSSAQMTSGKPQKSLIYHVNPMPNYMQVAMKYGAELNLSEQQRLTLSNWREAHKPVMSDLVRSVDEHESELRSMALENAKEEDLVDQYIKIEELRSKIVMTKINCRSMMKNTLTQHQFETLQNIYQSQFLKKHANAW